MNKLYLLVIIIVSLGFIKKENDFDFRITNKTLKEGDSISLAIKNNTMYSYCFLIDSSFSCVQYPEYYYKDSFFSPKMELYNLENTLIDELIFTKNNSINFKENAKAKPFNKILRTNRSKCGDLKLFTIKPKEILYFKIPISLVSFLDDDTFKYYALKSNECFLQMNYLQKEKFITERIAIKIQDSVAKQGIKFFNGELKSNRVKLKINIKEYDASLKELKNFKE